MRGKLTGMLILIAAVAIAWAIVAVGQAHVQKLIEAMLGPARAAPGTQLFDTLFYLLVFGPMIVVALIGGALDRRNALAPGDRPLSNLGMGLLIGFAGLTVSMLYAKLAGVLTPGSGTGIAGGALIWGLGVVVLQTAAEEIYFRGWLQPALVSRWGAVAGVGASALAFAALHIAGGARAPISLLNLALGGVMFGLFALRGQGIAGALGVHFAWNGSEQLAFGLDPNPGLGTFGSIVDKDLVGAAIWGGSADGLNGSIGMTFVLLAILAPLALLSSRRVAPVTAPAQALRTQGSPG